MPFGPWASFSDCVADVQKREGYDEETARKVCGALQRKLESSSTTASAKPCGCSKKSTIVAGVLARTLTVSRVRASIPIGGDDGVERPAPDAAPTAFRIWRAGENPTSKGMTLFTKKSAETLLAEQNERGNLYSIDVDHMSLSDGAPPENHRAVGWHRLAVRDTKDGPELWAVDVEWTPEVKAALESKPPGFRYFSPAYDVMRETGEVVGYLNTALTNNPATYQVTALATRAAEPEDKPMKMDDILAALKAAAEGDDEAQAKKAKAALAALTASEDEEKKEDDDAPPPPSEKKEGDGDDAEEKKDDAADGDGDEEKKDSIAAALDAKTVEKIVERKLQSVKDEAERDRLLASRKDIPEKLAASLKKQPLATVKEILDGIPVAARKNPAADAQVTATRGDTQGDRASSLPPEEKRKLDERMGLVKPEGAVKLEGVNQIFATIPPAQARRMLASKGGK